MDGRAFLSPSRALEPFFAALDAAVEVVPVLSLTDLKRKLIA